MSDLLDKKLSVIIPVFNSQQTIALLVKKVSAALKPYLREIEFILVNDCSLDHSHEVILELCEQNSEQICYVQLNRNFGEHNATMCGLNFVSGDCAVIIDDDFQNPPGEIIKLVNTLYEENADVVYSYYKQKKHPFFRNLGSKFNGLVAYIILKKPKGLYLSSFKVLSRDLVDIIIQYTGPYPYVDALILRSTNRISNCLCEHNKRESGKSNYNLWRLIKLWLNMFIGFSVWPLRIVAIIGLGFSFLAIFMIFYIIASRIFGSFIIKQEIPVGWASTVSLITLFSGVQLFGIAILGEYLGRLVLTINKEPQYLIRKVFHQNSKTQKYNKDQKNESI